MESILFSTLGQARKYIENKYKGYEVKEDNYGGYDVDSFVFDDSMNYLMGICDGEVPALLVKDEDCRVVATLGYWEEGGDYVIYVAGNPVKTVDHWSWAMHEMKNLSYETEEKIECHCPDGEIISWEEVEGRV